MTPSSLALAIAFAYLLGAIPSGMIVARLYRNVDLRTYGSGKTGATNVLRTLGPGAAAIVFAADFAKGVLAVLLAAWLSQGDEWVKLLAAVAAVIGHSFSPFIGFKGGRGVVTGIAVTAVAGPWQMLVAFSVGAVLIYLTRYVSLGSIVGAVVGGLLMIATAVMAEEPALALWGTLVAGFIVVSHRDNIQRLMSGTERRIGTRA